MKVSDKIIVACLAGVIIFTCLAYYLNESRRWHTELNNARAIERDISERFFLTIDAFDYALPEDAAVFDRDGKASKLTDILPNTRLALYINSRHCGTCWQKEIEYLNSHMDSFSTDVQPIIITQHFTKAGLEIVRTQAKCPVFEIRTEQEFASALVRPMMPFYFLLEDGAKITSPFFPTRNPSSSIQDDYFRRATEKCNREVGVDGDLKVINPDEYLGTLQIRKMCQVKYLLKNKGDETCELYGCSPSCSCIVVDSFSTFIAPGDTGYVAISTVQTNQGDFAHSVNVSTSCRTMPYTLSFHGYCE